ncbi:ABC transporter ATP-binding protein [Luteococcus sp. OSA5]|uniref:ABC transporter ATP-binding protein n=1 Tax=Luteococcus sp. OSA5 TaxID=3401630 RepID=UPI003B43CBD2
MSSNPPASSPQQGSPSGAEIVFNRVTKRYPGQKKPAVDELSLVIPAGEMVMFVGPSGCGKTTSLKMINRLHEPTSGTITIAGEDITSRNEDELRRKIGYVIQGGSLFPHQTVAQNIAVVPKLLKWDRRRIDERVDELLDLVGLDPAIYRSRYPKELSGGQQQRVGVARGLAADPPVILMDEPFGAVDPITRQRLQDELMSIQSELRKTIVCVTHDIDEAIKLGDRILILTEGAHVAQYDTPQNILAAPANSFVEDFIGAGSSLKQLSLVRVDNLPLTEEVHAFPGEDAVEVRRRAWQQRADSVVLLDQRRRPIDWLRLNELPAEGPLPESHDPNLMQVDRRATLNDALDAMLTSAHGAVIVTGQRDQFLGTLAYPTVAEHVHVQASQATQEDDLSQRPETPGVADPTHVERLGANDE